MRGRASIASRTAYEAGKVECAGTYPGMRRLGFRLLGGIPATRVLLPVDGMPIAHHSRVDVRPIGAHAIAYDPVVAGTSRRAFGRTRFCQEGIQSFCACLTAPVRVAGSVLAHLPALGCVDAFEANPHAIYLDRIAVDDGYPPPGRQNVNALIKRTLEDDTLPQLARELFNLQAKEYQAVEARLEEVEAKLMKWHRTDDVSRRIATIPGIGPIGSTMLSVKAPPAENFSSGRHFAAWLGLTPKDHSTGGRVRLGGITKAGDPSIRSTLIVGATALLRHARKGRTKPSRWLAAMLERKPPKLVAVAQANRFARIAWRLMISGGVYEKPEGPVLSAAV